MRWCSPRIGKPSGNRVEVTTGTHFIYDPGVDRLHRRGAECLAGGELGDPLKTVD